MEAQVIFLPVAPLVNEDGIEILAAFTTEESAQLAARNEEGGIVIEIALLDSYADFLSLEAELASIRDAALAKLTEEEKATLGL